MTKIEHIECYGKNIELNKIYNMDCMEGMKEIPDNSIDIVITSPPYNLGSVHHTGGKRFKAYNTYDDNLPEPEYQEWQTNVLNEVQRILKPDGSLFYNHKNRIRKGRQISPYEWILNSNLVVKQELVWFNGSQNFDKIRFYPMTERVYWLSKTEKTNFRNNINHHDLFDWTSVGTGKSHKRAFPITMVKDILKCFPGGIVLDPFSGSGTVGIACHDLGFEFIGFEIDPDYCRMATERLEAHKAQLNMFTDMEGVKND